MKIKNKMILSFFIFTSCIIFGSSLNTSHHTHEDVLEMRLEATELVERSFDLHPISRNILNIFDHKDFIDELVKPTKQKLILIIADDLNASINLAENLQGNVERIVPKKEHLSETQKPIYDALLKRYHIYDWDQEDAQVFAYGRSLKNDILGIYIANRVFSLYKESKIILTDNKLTVDSIGRMLDTASEILVDDSMNYEFPIRFSHTSNIDDPSFLENIKKYSEDLNWSDNHDVSLLEALQFISSHDWTDSYRRGVVALSSPIALPVHFDDFAQSLLHRMGIILKSYSLEEIQTNVYDLAGVFSMIEILETKKKGLSKLSKCVNGTLPFQNCVEDICSDGKRNEITNLLCFMNQVLFVETIVEDSQFKRRLLKEIDKKLLFDLEKSLSWYKDLKEMYDNLDIWNKTDVVDRSLNLQYRIYTSAHYIIRIDKIKELALKTVSTIIENKWMTISCLPMKTGYRMQVRAEVLRLDWILKKNYCKGKVRVLEIFALDTIYTDREMFGYGSEMLMIIFAPTWVVLRERTMFLTGDYRELQLGLKVNFRADNGTEDGNHNGANGLPGLPGGPGSSFYGIANKFINGENLIIKAHGGTGSPGQDGGHALSNTKYLSSGGKGGMGGKGGRRGIVKIISLDDTDDIPVKILAEDGKDGRSGDGGLDSKRKKEMQKNTIGYRFPEDPPVFETFAQAVNHYKNYILSTTLKIDGNKYIPLLNQLNSNKNIRKTYTTLPLVEELMDLENYYFQLKNKSDSVFLLKSWRERSIEYSKNRTASERDKKYAEVFHILDEKVTLKIDNLESELYSRSILSIKKYLMKCLSQGEELQVAAAVVDVKETSRQFQIDLLKEIEEGQRILVDDVQVYIDSKLEELNNDINTLLKEIAQMIETKKYEIEDLNHKKEELKKKFKWRVIFGILKGLSAALLFTGPAGAAVGVTLSTTTTIVESNLLDSQNPELRPAVAIPKAISHSIELSLKNYDDLVKERKAFVEKNIELIDVKTEQIKKTGEPTQPLDEIRNELVNLSAEQLGKLDQAKTTGILKRAQDRWEKLNLSAKLKNIEAVKVIKVLKASAELIDSGYKTYLQIAKDNSEISKIDELMEKASNELRQSEDYKERVQTFLFPIMDQIRRSIVKKNDEFAVQSITYLTFQSWKMEEYLNTFSTEMEVWTKGFKAEKDFTRTVDKLKNAMRLMIDIHIRIKEFVHEIKSTRFKEAMSNAAFTFTHLNNVHLSTALAKLTQRQLANSLLDDYVNWINSLMQYSFPFAQNFLRNNSTLDQELDDDPVTKAEAAARRLKSIHARIISGESLDELFPHTSTATFGTSGSRPPFYVWKNSSHSSKIRKILKGQTVKLFANISKETELNAVKISGIRLKFQATNSKMNKDLNRDLKNYAVIAVHHGDSYYRCDEKVFLISSGAHQFREQYFVSKEKRSIDDQIDDEFEKKISIFEASHNNTSVTLKQKRFAKDNLYGKRDYVLSPFATWTIQLVSIPKSRGFHALKKYANHINLKLVGDGMYASSNLDVCQSDLTRYYGTEKQI